MTRGTFANVRVKNALAKDPSTGKVKEGGWTKDMSKKGGGKIDFIYNASVNYKAEGTPLVVLAGKDYGMGSSRDWAAKGTLLLGVRAVISESFERIHRSNLIGMGVLPLQFVDGESVASLGLSGREVFDFVGLDGGGAKTVTVIARSEDGASKSFKARVRIDTPKELEYYRHGGILQYVLRSLAARGASA